MTVSVTNNRNDYEGNGSTNQYDFTFRIFEDTDLRVLIRNPDAEETVLGLNTDYSVDGVDEQSGGEITLIDADQEWLDGSGRLLTGYHLTIRRVLPLTQLTDIRNQGDFFPAIHEDQFDRDVMIAQQQADDLNRSVKLSETSDPNDFDATFPVGLVGNPGASLVVNETGDGFTVGPSAGDISGAQAAAATAVAASEDALLSEQNAADSEAAAALSEQNAADSEAAAAISETNAAASEAVAEAAADDAEIARDQVMAAVSLLTGSLYREDFESGLADGYETFNPEETLGSDDNTSLSVVDTVGEALHGSFSLKLDVTDFSTSQGAGFVVPFDIPEGYEGVPLYISFVYKVISGTYTSGNLALKMGTIASGDPVEDSDGDNFLKLQQGRFVGTVTRTASDYLVFYLAATPAANFSMTIDDVVITATAEGGGGSGSGVESDDNANLAASVPTDYGVAFDTTNQSLATVVDVGVGKKYASVPQGTNFMAPEDRDAEYSVGNWVAYADAAAATPVDGTGGSPTVTITRTTSNPLNGSASFLLTKDASNRQGQGVSVTLNSPLGYRGRKTAVRFAYRVASGTYTTGDVKAFVISDPSGTPVVTEISGNSLAFSNGVVEAVFDGTSATSYRLVLHVTSTSASAYTIAFDDVYVGPQTITVGATVGDWISYAPIWTASSVNPSIGNGVLSGWYKRVGDNLLGRIYLNRGSSTSNGTGDWFFSIPPNLSVDATKIDTNDFNTVIGSGIANDTGTARYVGTAAYRDSTSIRVFTATNAWGAAQPMVWASGDTASVEFSVPVVGWGSTAVLQNSQVYRMSSYMANGTRVTAAPTQLGEYRSYLRNSSAFTFTETNGAPGTAPSAINGIFIYQGNAFGTADTNNEPSRYDVFVGRNKTVDFEFYASTGRTGYVSADPDFINDSPNRDVGYRTHYDPSTGIAVIMGARKSGGTATHIAGIDAVGNTISDYYFDIIVSDNPVPVQVDVFDSVIRLDTHAGYGSTNTRVPYYTNTSVEGSDLSLTTNNATSGAIITVNKRGKYTVMFQVNSASGGAANAGIIVNGSGNYSTDVSTLSNAIRKAYGNVAAIASNNSTPQVSWTGRLFPGDTINSQTDAGVPVTAARSVFEVTRVG